MGHLKNIYILVLCQIRGVKFDFLDILLNMSYDSLSHGVGSFLGKKPEAVLLIYQPNLAYLSLPSISLLLSFSWTLYLFSILGVNSVSPFYTPAFRWIILFITVQEAFENSFVDQLHSCILSQDHVEGP